MRAELDRLPRRPVLQLWKGEPIVPAILCALVLACPVRGGPAIGPDRGGQALQPPVPHLANWICIHGYEAAWNDSGDPYWGGLQMDREFMRTYGAAELRAHHGGLADTWTPREQMVVANRALPTRGYYPWPQTARECGLI